MACGAVGDVVRREFKIPVVVILMTLVPPENVIKLFFSTTEEYYAPEISKTQADLS